MINDAPCQFKQLQQQLLTDTDACVRCGLCVPKCPTYQLSGIENESPRGRIMQFQALANGQVTLTPRMSEYLDHCLACMKCQAICPAHVDYRRILQVGRVLQRQQSRSRLKRIKRDIRHHIINNRYLTAIFRWMIWLLQQSPLQKWLPDYLPIIDQPQPWQSVYNAQATDAVYLFLGCASNLLEQQVLGDAIAILTHLQVKVIIPKQQNCCGARLRWHHDLQSVEQLSVHNRQVFTKPIPTLSITPGCVAESDYLSDIHQFLFSMIEQRTVTLKPIAKTVFVHIACSQQFQQTQPPAMLSLLQLIPKLRIIVLDEIVCCGASGEHFLEDADHATAILTQYLKQDMFQDNSSCILSANISCRCHMQRMLRQNNLNMEVLHPLTFLKKAL